MTVQLAIDCANTVVWKYLFVFIYISLFVIFFTLECFQPLARPLLGTFVCICITYNAPSPAQTLPMAHCRLHRDVLVENDREFEVIDNVEA